MSASLDRDAAGGVRATCHCLVGTQPVSGVTRASAKSYLSLHEHTVGYGPFWGNGIPEHLPYLDLKSLNFWAVKTVKKSTSRTVRPQSSFFSMTRELVEEAI